MFMARILTVPEIVNSRNIKALRTLIINGPQHYPGANYLVSKNLTRDLTYANRRLAAKQLQIGDTVERHL